MRFAVSTIAILSLSGCAYVGDPLPPALRIPKPITDLAASQSGGDILVSFTIPDTSMEEIKLSSIGAVELKIGPSTAAFNAEAWSASARTLDTTTKEPGKAEVKIPVRDWANQEVVLGVRTANAKMRVSPWSNFVTLKIVSPLDKPSQVSAIATIAGVVLKWANPTPRPAVEWKLFRRSAGEAAVIEIATVKTPTYTDTGASFDILHRYEIQAIEAGATSERSDPLSITPVDTFAPAIPQGLSALAGPASAQLSWERNQEQDLALYRIYRAISNGPFTKIAESPAAANYRDAAVTAGATYRYSISAVDRKGNESTKSEPMEILIP